MLKQKRVITPIGRFLRYTLFTLVFMTLIASVYIDSFLEIEPLASHNYDSLESGWRIEKEGILIEENVTLPYRMKGGIENKQITLSRNLPPTFLHNHMCFSAYTSMTSLEILIDGVSIYNYHGNNTLWKRPVLGGHTAHFIYLPDDSKGKEITLVYNFPTNNSIAGYFDVPRIGTKTDLILLELSEWPSVVFGFVFLFIGFIVTAVSFLYPHKVERLSLRHYGILEITLGMWVFTQTMSKILIFRNPVLPMNFSIFALFLLPYALIQYVKTSYSVLDKKTYPFYLASLLFLGMFVVGGVSQYFGIFQYTDMLVLSGLFLVLFILSLTVVLSIDYYKGNRNLFSFLAAISVLLITVVTEEVLLIFDINIENALILHIGMSISGTILLIRTAKVIASERAISVREKMLVELAFTDSLTGVHNRRSFDDFIDSCIHEGNPDTVLGILLCDINGLKLINDFYGHSNGDAILRDFSRKLTSMLPQGSIIYRIGGDEFVATIPNITNEQLELLCKDVFDIPNKGDVDDYSVAIGVRLYSAYHSKDITTLIKEADKAMYECKAKMKEGVIEPICKTAE